MKKMVKLFVAIVVFAIGVILGSRLVDAEIVGNDPMYYALEARMEETRIELAEEFGGELITNEVLKCEDRYVVCLEWRVNEDVRTMIAAFDNEAQGLYMIRYVNGELVDLQLS